MYDKFFFDFSVASPLRLWLCRSNWWRHHSWTVIVVRDFHYYRRQCDTFLTKARFRITTRHFWGTRHCDGVSEAASCPQWPDTYPPSMAFLYRSVHTASLPQFTLFLLLPFSLSFL